MFPFMTNLTFWSLPGCSVSSMPGQECNHKRKEAIQYMIYCLIPQVTEPLELVGMDLVGRQVVATSTYVSWVIISPNGLVEN